jgi:adenylylsulfate kinase
MTNSPSNLVWHSGNVTRSHRQSMMGQEGTTIWLTGLSASGKSTLAFALERTLFHMGRLCYALDGDNVRHGLNKNLGFSESDRAENIRRVAEVARLMNDAGLIVITAFISPFRNDRETARQIIGPDYFHEVFLCTPLETCESRDPKGLYRKARSGLLADFTGISSPYEIPAEPRLVIDTAQTQVESAVSTIIREVLNKAPTD